LTLEEDGEQDAEEQGERPPTGDLSTCLMTRAAGLGLRLLILDLLPTAQPEIFWQDVRGTNGAGRMTCW
jgi:hypothetical protein